MVRWIAVASCVAMAWIPEEALAARQGFAFIQTGEEIFEVGPLPDAVTSTETRGWSAGQKCRVFGVFWAYVHWWDCAPVAFRDAEYSDEPVIVAAIEARYTRDDVQMGPWARYGRFVLGAGLIAVLLAQLRSD